MTPLPQSVTIRPAALNDAAQIAVLSGQLGYPADAGATARRLTALLAQEEHVVLVAAIGEAIAGWGHGFARISLIDEPYFEVGGLVVGEGYRSQGIGHRLLAALEEAARGLGCATVSVRSNAIRERAHRFYTERGYSLIKQQAVFRRALSDSSPTP